MFFLSNSPNKKSVIDGKFNKYVYSIFFVQLIFCILCSFGGAIWLFLNSKYHWYLDLHANGLNFWYFIFLLIRNYGTNYILYAQLIPMALYVNMEFTKFMEARLLQFDDKMTYRNKDKVITPNSKTPTIFDDLGIINIVFSDKTGTLTSNEMKFLKCSIKGTK